MKEHKLNIKLKSKTDLEDYEVEDLQNDIDVIAELGAENISALANVIKELDPIHKGHKLMSLVIQSKDLLKPMLQNG